VCSEADFEPIIPFLTDDPLFCDGVEIGFLFKQMEKEDFEFNGVYHKTNREQIEVMAQRMKYTVSFEDYDETWIQAKFSKRMLRLVEMKKE
jgi:hypothetical protein